MGAIKNFYNTVINQQDDFIDDDYFFDKWSKKIEEEVMNWVAKQEENLMFDIIYEPKEIKDIEFPNWMINGL